MKDLCNLSSTSAKMKQLLDSDGIWTPMLIGLVGASAKSGKLNSSAVPFIFSVVDVKTTFVREYKLQELRGRVIARGEQANFHIRMKEEASLLQDLIPKVKDLGHVQVPFILICRRR